MSKRAGASGILIIGHPRSGTTLLRRLLDAHSAIASPPETHLFSACGRFLEADHTADGVDMGVLGGLHFAGFDDDHVVLRLRELAFSFLQDYAERQGKSRWAEKTAFNVFHLEAIERLCADAVFYLGILRHPFDVAVSCKEFCDAAGVYPKPMHAYLARYPQPIEAFVRSWVATSSALLELGKRHPSRCIICRYEDLVAAPERTLEAILEFVGEYLEPDMIPRALGQLDRLGFSDHKSYQVDHVHTQSIARWHSLPRSQISRLAPLVNPLLSLCGYKTVATEDAPAREETRRRYATSLMIHAKSRSSR